MPCLATSYLSFSLSAKGEFCRQRHWFLFKEGENVYGRESSASETIMICMRRATAWHGEVKGHECCFSFLCHK